MPRRIPDYPDAFAGWNAVSSLGSLISVAATGLFIYIIYDIYTNDKVESHNPWSLPAFFISLFTFKNLTPVALTLEWSIKSPAPFHAYSSTPVQS